MGAAASGAFGQRIDEFVVGPGADSGLRIGRDVGRDEFAERRFDRPAAGEIAAAAGQRVARRAIAGDGEIMSVFDLAEILLVDARRLRRQRPAQCGAGEKNARQSRQTFESLRHERAAPDS